MMELWRVILPYCLQKESEDVYSMLNREYQPVGSFSEKGINNKDITTRMNLRITPEIACQLSFDGKSNVDSIYLYNDGCPPVGLQENIDRYFNKLKILASLELLEKEDKSPVRREELH